jgi:hypothetical protein
VRAWGSRVFWVEGLCEQSSGVKMLGDFWKLKVIQSCWCLDSESQYTDQEMGLREMEVPFLRMLNFRHNPRKMGIH